MVDLLSASDIIALKVFMAGTLVERWIPVLGGLSSLAGGMAPYAYGIYAAFNSANKRYASIVL